MSDFDIQAVVDSMTATLKERLGDLWESAGTFAAAEARKFTQSMEEVMEWKVQGQIDEDMAYSLMRLHRRSMKMVLAAAKGISLAMAEKAVDDAVDGVKGMVNGAIGFRLV